MEVLFLITAFEAICNCRVEIRMAVVDTKGTADMEITLAAVDRKSVDGVVNTLASVSVTCSGTNLRTLQGVLTHALYMLDGKLAAGEFESVLNQ